MRAGVRSRCLAAWAARVARRRRLEALEELASAASARWRTRVALRAWWDRVGMVAAWREATAAVAARRMRAALAVAFGGWQGRTAEKRRDQEVFGLLVRRDVLRVCDGAWGRWRGALEARRKLAHAKGVLLLGTKRRCFVHWKSRVDYKVDWRAFQAAAVQRVSSLRWGAENAVGLVVVGFGADRAHQELVLPVGS